MNRFCVIVKCADHEMQVGETMSTREAAERFAASLREDLPSIIMTKYSVHVRMKNAHYNTAFPDGISAMAGD